MSENCSCEKCELKGLFYKNVDDAEIEEICSIKIEKEYKKGETIIQVGDKISDFVYLKEGLVKLLRYSDNGSEQIFTIAKPFDFVNLLSILSRQTYNYSVVAIEPSIICILPLSIFSNLILSNNLFALSVMKKISSVSDKIIQESLEIKQRHLKGRVAYILFFFADVIYKSNYFALPVSRKEIASFIGMSTENVIRTLSEFRKEEIIGIFGKHIEILQLSKLKKISELG